MGGGILQLVANGGSENRFVDHDPQITMFKNVYRRHSQFSFEHINVPFRGVLKFGGSAEAELLPMGDLLYRMFVVIEIPKLAAAFLNTKANDLVQLVMQSNFSDQVFDQQVKRYLSTNDTIEFGKVINIIEQNLACYASEDTVRLNVLDQLTKFVDPLGETINANDTLPYYPPTFTPGTMIIPLPNLDLNALAVETRNIYNFVTFKTILANMWTQQKKKYYLIHKFLESIYANEIITQTPLIDTFLLSNTILYANVFFNMIPNKEILIMYWLKNENFLLLQTQVIDSLLDIFNSGLTTLNANIVNNLTQYQNFNQFYSTASSIPPFSNPDYALDPTAFNMNSFLRQVAFSLNDNPGLITEAQAEFYNYGPMFFYLLNSYNTIIQVIKNISTTIPIITGKAFQFANPPQTVYAPGSTDTFVPINYPTNLDPNFKANFLLDLNMIEMPSRFVAPPHNFVPSYTDPNDQLYPSKFVNQYLRLFNGQATAMFNNIEIGIETLYIYYQTNTYMFNTVNTVYYNQDPLNASATIYFYFLPTLSFQDDTALRVQNTFNLTAFFFYFFMYLDTVDETKLAAFVNANYNNNVPLNLNLNLSPNALLYLQNMITLLKRNVDFYMQEISYYLNDLYSNAPSSDVTDTMKNYVPIAVASTVDGVDIINGLLVLTTVFHRNLVPTILEMFEFIYFFIDTITLTKINTYLGTSIAPVTPEEDANVRLLNKLFYYCIFQHFMNVYDSFKFELPANYSLNAFNPTIVGLMQGYVNTFLLGTYIDPAFAQPTTLSNNLYQMEFYFAAEFLHMRELGKFYHNTLFNEELILSTVGDTSYRIIQMINKIFTDLDPFVINIDAISASVDPVRTYFDILFQHNATMGQPDNLYYSTFNVDRYTGQTYPNTPYTSRFYGIVPQPPATLPLAPPIPLPPNDPYGVPPAYYDHQQVTTSGLIITEPLNNYIPVYWTNQTNPFINSQNPTTSFQLFSLDYFRIKHSVFYNPQLIVPSDVVSVDPFQEMCLRLIEQVEVFISIYPARDYNLLYAIWISSYYLTANVNPLSPYDGFENVYLPFAGLTIDQLLKQFELRIYNELQSTNTTTVDQSYAYALPLDCLNESLNCFNELFTKFNNGVIVASPVSFPVQPAPYTNDVLIKNNSYVYNLVANANATNNITQLITLQKNNFLSQYFYFDKFQASIVGIEQLGLIDNIFNFQNISVINYEVLSAINFNNVDLSLLKNISPLVYIFPDVYPTQVAEIITLQHELDDFSQNISNLTTVFFTTNDVPRLTLKDVYDIVNTNFDSIREIYSYLTADITSGIYTYVYDILGGMQPLLLNKNILVHQIFSYVQTNIAINQLMTTTDIANIVLLAVAMGINSMDYTNYLVTQIQPAFNSAVGLTYTRLVIITTTLPNDLDYFLIKWNRSISVSPGITFKSYIIGLIFTPTFLAENPSLHTFFTLVSSNNYSFIYIFLTYATKNGLTPQNIFNVITTLDESDFINIKPTVVIQYNSFDLFTDVISYMMDYVWDWSMTICDQNPADPAVQAEFNLTNKFSFYVNEFHTETQAIIATKIAVFENDQILQQQQTASEAEAVALQELRNEYFKQQWVQSAIATVPSVANPTVLESLEKVAEPTTIPISNYDYYLDSLGEKQAIINFIKQITAEGIVLTNAWNAELVSTKNQVYNILYRNKRAKVAWIRKLAHYLIRDVKLKSDDGESLDVHYSDWFESMHQLTAQPGSEKGYNRMIGHIDDLIIFDDKLKKSYELYLPLIFWSNRNPASALPLTANINSKLLVEVQLRNLSDVAYKEQFSDWIDPSSYDQVTNPDSKYVLAPFTPQITKAHLICEYIFLTTEERRLYCTRQLEYLIEELQYDFGRAVSDHNLKNIYKVADGTKTVTYLQNGIKTQETFNDPSKGFYLEEDRLTKGLILLPKNNYQYVPIVDRTGVEKLFLINKPPSKTNPINPFIHRKRITYTHHFNHPSEMILFLVKINKHTQPIFRIDESEYFYGEKQYDNYGLYPIF